MTTHSDKALATFANLGTVATDWFHPAVRWVEEERMVPGWVNCPTCAGHKWVRLDGAGKVLPLPTKPVFKKSTYSYVGQEEWDNYFRAARDEHAKRMGWQNAGFNGNCPDCRTQKRGWGLISTGSVKGLVKARVMVGYIVWPKDAKCGHTHHTSNQVQCQVCGKAIPSGRRVPLAHEKDGKAFWLFAGEDCAKKFSKVAVLKASKQVNPKGLECHLAENLEYVVKE